MLFVLLKVSTNFIVGKKIIKQISFPLYRETDFRLFDGKLYRKKNTQTHGKSIIYYRMEKTKKKPYISSDFLVGGHYSTTGSVLKSFGTRHPRRTSVLLFIGSRHLTERVVVIVIVKNNVGFSRTITISGPGLPV